MTINQIQNERIFLFLTEKFMIFQKYSNILDIFSKKLTVILLKYFNINKYTIGLKLDKQLLYRPVYSLDAVELETLKTYIKTNLTKIFI